MPSQGIKQKPASKNSVGERREGVQERLQLQLKKDGLELWGKVAAYYREGVWLSSLFPPAPMGFARHSLERPRYLAQVEHKVVLGLYSSLDQVKADIDGVLKHVKTETTSFAVSDAAERLRIIAQQTYTRIRSVVPPPPSPPHFARKKLEPTAPSLPSKPRPVPAPAPRAPPSLLPKPSSSPTLNTVSRSQAQADALKIFAQQVEIDALKAEVAELKAARASEESARKRKREEVEAEGDGLEALNELLELLKDSGKSYESEEEVGVAGGEPMEMVVEEEVENQVEAVEEAESSRSRPNLISRSLSPQKPSTIATSPATRRAVSIAPPVTPAVAVSSWSLPPTSSPWVDSPHEGQKRRRLDWSEIKDQRRDAERVG
ncbi:hypothetical protein BDY24DRAFT_399739 [Mrakia frigida]|uniref:uncharacterized protein n=1 Tax=Mrakia frigida TaxID=29902 RepID=UPI003FCBF2BC